MMEGRWKEPGDSEPGNWVLLLALLVLTLDEVIKVSGNRVLICQRWRMGCKAQCSVRNFKVMWPIGQRDLS